MKKIICLILSVFFCSCFISAQVLTARSVADESAKEDTADDSIVYIKSNLDKLTDPAEKRALYAFLGALQEQCALFDDARDSYAAAAAIAAGDAPGMPVKSSEQLVLDAVRCALSSGDSATADSYLNSAVRNSDDGTIQAYIKLYALWSSLCRAESSDDLAEPVVMLRTYAVLPSMTPVKPAVLLTLWYITGDDTYADSLRKEFPSSPEAGIVTGTVQLLPAPFWYFIPRKTGAQPELITDSGSNAAAADTGDSEKTADDVPADVQKPKKLQMGLFREKANADSLVSTLTDKGFKPYITTETRASGTTYYIVVVDEADKSLEDNLKTAGFEFCPIF
ncbi:MAG: SPOR domain-containing protein [Treponema sp.]|nr:SPOR domain-containing protein [Treponema sp.]